MNASVAELTLIFKAQNLATSAFTAVETSMGNVALKAKTVAGDVARAFKGLGPLLAQQLVQVGADLVTGKDATKNFEFLGIIFAGAILDGLSATLIPGILGWLGKTAVFAPVVAALTAEGATLGSVTAAAFGAAMSLALPALIIAAVVLALTNPDVQDSIRRGVQALIKSATDFSNDTKRPGGMLPRTGSGGSSQRTRGFASGGWVGLNGPEVALVGERGPEYVNPAGPGTPGGFTIQGISEREIIDMVDRGLYFRLQRAAPTTGR